MSKFKFVLYAGLLTVGVMGYNKWSKKDPVDVPSKASSAPIKKVEERSSPVENQPILVENTAIETPKLPSKLTPLTDDRDLPKSVDRMALLFQPHPPTLPIVETLSFSSKPCWLRGRPAYLGDYAAHFKTSKHFISRSLHGVNQYLSDVVSKGDRFNVIRMDHAIEFHMALDLSRLKLWLYAYDSTTDQRYLLKDYLVAAGKPCTNSPSGCLTPTGSFELGKDIAVYNEGTMGFWHNQKIEMLSIFGRRWIPFAREISDSSGPCKGLGIHGMPCKKDPITGGWIECRDSAGTHASDGCVRMLSEDISELFAVVVSRPSFIHIARDFSMIKLPGKEVSL
jgi:hypothetical protein